MDLFNQNQNSKMAIIDKNLNILTQMEIKLLNIKEIITLVKIYFFMETDLLRKESNTVLAKPGFIILIPKEIKLVKKTLKRMDMNIFFTMMDLFNIRSIILITQKMKKPIMIKTEIYCILSKFQMIK